MIPEIRVTAVQQGTVPPYAYTQGATALAGRELVCAGALRYDVHEIDRNSPCLRRGSSSPVVS